MEQLNRIELKGTVGSVYVKDFKKTKVTNFSVATNYVCTAKDGTPVIETTWHRVIAWDCPEITKGSKVHVIGRLRANRYTDANGNQKFVYEVLANGVKVIGYENV